MYQGKQSAKYRKGRQEKLRKRSKCGFKKIKALAWDTDAWTYLAVRDKYGVVSSFNAAPERDWFKSPAAIVVSQFSVS